MGIDNEQENEVTLNLSVSEVNLILDSLANLPFKQVYKLIEKIHVQADADHNND